MTLVVAVAVPVRGAPMHGSSRHRKPDLILLAEGLICPREREGGTEEYYDETGETDGRTDRLRGTEGTDRPVQCTAFFPIPPSNFPH